MRRGHDQPQPERVGRGPPRAHQVRGDHRLAMPRLECVNGAQPGRDDQRHQEHGQAQLPRRDELGEGVARGALRARREREATLDHGRPADFAAVRVTVVVSPPMKPRRLNPAWPAGVTGGVVVSTLSTSGMNTALRSARPDVANVVPKTKLIREASSGFSAYVAKASSPVGEVRFKLSLSFSATNPSLKSGLPIRLTWTNGPELTGLPL